MIGQHKSLLEKVKDRIRETADAGLILDRHRETLLRELDDNTLDFRVPQKVIARIRDSDDAEYTLDKLWCSNCGRIYEFQSVLSHRLKCPQCKRALSQAPVFVANYPTRPFTPVPFSEVVRETSSDWNARYCIYTGAPMKNGQRLARDVYKGLKATDANRPIDSLCWTCPIPNEPCAWRDSSGFCKYSYYDSSGREPSEGGRVGTAGGYRPDLQKNSGRIRMVAPPFARRRTAFGTFLERYRPVTLSEGITKPVRIAIHSFFEENATELSFPSDELVGIQTIMHVKKLEIFQFTLALALGLPYTAIKKRPVVLLTDSAPDGQEQYYLLSRRLLTEGILIRLRRPVIDTVLDEWTTERPGVARNVLGTTLYHTVSHALLKPLPMIAGLDASDFSESFSASDNEIAVYDNSPGGIGGVKTLVEEGHAGAHLARDYSAQLLASHQCQLECSWSCKACIQIGNCGWINRQLQREMLPGIFNEQLRNRYLTV